MLAMSIVSLTQGNHPRHTEHNTVVSIQEVMEIIWRMRHIFVAKPTKRNGNFNSFCTLSDKFQ